MFDKHIKKDVSEVQEKILKDIIEKEANLSTKLNMLNEITVNVKKNLVSIEKNSEEYGAKIQQITAFQNIIDNKMIDLHIKTFEIEQKVNTKIVNLNIELEERLNIINEKILSMESKPSKLSKKVLECSDCGKQYPPQNEVHYRNHVLDKHTELKNSKCYACGVNIPHISHMDGHMRKHHKKPVNAKQKK